MRTVEKSTRPRYTNHWLIQAPTYLPAIPNVDLTISLSPLHHSTRLHLMKMIQACTCSCHACGFLRLVSTNSGRFFFPFLPPFPIFLFFFPTLVGLCSLLPPSLAQPGGDRVRDKVIAGPAVTVDVFQANLELAIPPSPRE